METIELRVGDEITFYDAEGEKINTAKVLNIGKMVLYSPIEMDVTPDDRKNKVRFIHVSR